ncbi:MAG: MarC family protein [Candidatus Marinimicrobia bacterium]|nr:MarC family protein [Candidatus Neomarinimicrobiota bacterium]MBL7022850.1 MarC family protein [Candidatus Neomarinimicrobiota bacterium]
MADIFQQLFPFFLLAFSSLFTLVNPIGLSPTFLSLISDFGEHEKKRITRKGIITATVVLIIFSLIGNLIFSFFGITLHAFRIAGGILFFKIGLNMLESKVSRTKSTPKESEEAQSKDEIAYTPIGIPLIAGPGAITSVMILSSEASTVSMKIVFFSTIFIVMILTYFIFMTADYMSKRFGTTGLRILQRIMGLILMVIAVQFVIDGLTPVIKGWIGTI